MEKRRLGRTGHQSTVVTFGAFAIGYVNQDGADRAIQLVLDHGARDGHTRATEGRDWHCRSEESRFCQNCAGIL